MKIFCVSGKAGSGKDTFADMLEEELTMRGEKVLITHYADLLKYICKTFFRWNGEKDGFGRSLLQWVGTDVVREKNPDFWVDFLIAILGFFQDRWTSVIIPDCRFENEIENLQCHTEWTVIPVRMVREEANVLSDEQRLHPSETSLDDFPFQFVIENTGTLEQLRDSAEVFAEHIKLRYD